MAIESNRVCGLSHFFEYDSAPQVILRCRLFLSWPDEKRRIGACFPGPRQRLERDPAQLRVSVMHAHQSATHVDPAEDHVMKEIVLGSRRIHHAQHEDQWMTLFELAPNKFHVAADDLRIESS